MKKNTGSGIWAYKLKEKVVLPKPSWFPSRGRMKMSGILAVSFIQLAGKQKEFTQISYPLRHDPEEEANQPPRILAQPHPKGLKFRKGSHCSRTFRVVVLAWSQVPVKIEPGPAKICFYGY